MLRAILDEIVNRSQYLNSPAKGIIIAQKLAYLHQTPGITIDLS